MQQPDARSRKVTPFEANSDFLAQFRQNVSLEGYDEFWNYGPVHDPFRKCFIFRLIGGALLKITLASCMLTFNIVGEVRAFAPFLLHSLPTYVVLLSLN